MIQTLSNPKEVKAVKQHVCDLCGQRIVKDEKYMKSTHAYDGRVYDFKTHKYCSKLANRMDMYKECDEGLTMYIFMENVSEKHYDILCNQLPSDKKNFGDILTQLRYVDFRQKLWFVIRYFNKLDKN